MLLAQPGIPLLNVKSPHLYVFCPNLLSILRLHFSALFQDVLGILATTRSMTHAKDVNPLGHLRKDRHLSGEALAGI